MYHHLLATIHKATASISDSGNSSLASLGSSVTSNPSAVGGSENLLATVLASDVTIKKLLGGGGFGVVFLATHKHWGDVAVKQLK